jgi:DNA (cytosine-5)-methyltransferase 1
MFDNQFGQEMNSNIMYQMHLYEEVQEIKKSDTFFERMDFYNVAGWPDVFGQKCSAWSSIKLKQPIKTLSIFSGAGGLDIGFHDIGFSILQCIEIEKKFVATLQENYQSEGYFAHSCDIICDDIKNYEPSDGLEIDFIIGGPPCQTFSSAGRRAAGVMGTDDARGTLFQEYIRLLKSFRPKGFLFENVYGIVGAQGGAAWREIQEGFNKAGYRIFFRILDAADYGVPQHRERLFIIGLREGEYKFPRPTHGPDSLTKLPYYSAGEATSNLLQKDEVLAYGLKRKYGYLLNEIPPGLNYSYYTKEMGHPRPIFAWRSKFSDFLYKADPNQPIRTLKAQGGQYTGPFHWDNRSFSLSELKRLQTFPDSYVMTGNKQVAIQQLGNSVPPQLARILALSVMNQVFGIELPFDLPVLEEGEIKWKFNPKHLIHYA